MRLNQIVVVGASLAGLKSVETLRKRSFDGRIVLIGAEAHLPYDRPPLSKAVLTGQKRPEDVSFHGPEKYADLDVELILGAPAERLDLHSRRVSVGNTVVPYDGLIIATGAQARQIPHGSMDGIQTLRTLEDARAIRSAIAKEPRVVVVGAGVIGCEVAASARAAGLEVTLVESLELPVLRAFGPVMGDAVARLHHDHGVNTRFGISITSFGGSERVEEVVLSDGQRLPADLVVVGIGVKPSTDWLFDSGLEVDDGINCDETLNAGPPGVFAVGDVVRWPSSFYSAHRREEHWTNAFMQGIHAAHNILEPANGKPYEDTPYVWSDQFGMRIESLGRLDADETLVGHGSLESGKFVVLHRRGGILSGVCGMGWPSMVGRYRKLVKLKTSWEDALAFSHDQE